MKLTDAQFGVLHTLREYGPKHGAEVVQARSMDGTRKTKVECHLLNAATLRALESAELVTVKRGAPMRPKDATGRKGKVRIPFEISISDKGRSALAASP